MNYNFRKKSQSLKLIFTILLLIISSLAYSQNLDNGLVAYYPFNGNANDESGNGYDGTIIGATLTTDRFGNPNNAYSLNGANQYIKLPSSINIQSNLSISFWIKTDLVDNDSWYLGSFLIDRDICGISRDWSVSIGRGGKIIFNTGDMEKDFPLYSKTEINNNAWRHIVVIRDASNMKNKIYVDGVLNNEQNFEKSNFTNNNIDIYVGASYCETSSHDYYKGSIDDIRIYNKAITKEEILFEFSRNSIGQEKVKNPKSLVDNPIKINEYVVDETDTLSSDQLNILISKLKDYDIQTTNQVVVYIIQSLNGEPIESVSISLSNYNKFGQKDKNNGVLLLIAINDRKLRLEVGEGLINTITDIQSTQIIREDIVPSFKNGNFYEGITKGIDAIISLLNNKLLNDAKYAFSEGNYLLVLVLLKDFPIDDPLYSEAVALMNQAIAKIPSSTTQSFVTVSGSINCGCSKAISGYVVFEDMNTRVNVGRCGITSDGYYCIVLPSGKIYSYYIDSKDFYPVSRIIDFTTTNQSPNYKDNIKIVTYEEMKEQQVSVRINNIFFDFNESKLKSESYLELDRMYKYLNDNPEISVEISGHTDNIGSDEYNITLSNARANAVKDYLVSKGISSSRIISKGYGKSIPVATNDTDEGRQLNRRVEFKIIK